MAPFSHDLAPLALLIRESAPPADGAAPDDTPSRWQYLQVIGVIAVLTPVCWFVPVDYHAVGHLYFLAVIVLSLRVGRGAALLAAIVSAVAWNYVFVPPRLSFSVLEFDDVLMLGTYLTVALIGGQLTARIREQERRERQRQHQAAALFHLTHALAAARTLDDIGHAAVRQTDVLFQARTALFVVDRRRLVMHPASTLVLDDRDRAIADWAWNHGQEAGRFTPTFPSVKALHLPMRCADTIQGVLALRLDDAATIPPPAQRKLMAACAEQIALLLEREQLRAAREREKLLHESNRLHRTLLDSVSHELKTPLAVLRTAGERLETESPGPGTELAREIRTATRRLDHLVANLLDQTRLDAGRLEPQLDWCDVRDLVAAARRAAAHALVHHAVEVTIPADLPLVMADAPLLEQALTNLLLNAALHTPAGTPVEIRAALEPAASRVEIAIVDHGPGIPPELMDDLFQKFRRGAHARAGGLGLGLSIVRGFMLAQGGGVTVTTTAGGGATFTLHLPHQESGGVPGDEC